MVGKQEWPAKLLTMDDLDGSVRLGWFGSIRMVRYFFSRTCGAIGLEFLNGKNPRSVEA